MSTISIIYGTNVAEMTCTLLQQSASAKQWGAKRLSAGMDILIKPNLVVASRLYASTNKAVVNESRERSNVA